MTQASARQTAVVRRSTRSGPAPASAVEAPPVSPPPRLNLGALAAAPALAAPAPRARAVWLATRAFMYEDLDLLAGDPLPESFTPANPRFRAINNCGMVEVRVRLADGTMVHPPFMAARNLTAGGRTYRGPRRPGEDGDVIPDAHTWGNFTALRRDRKIVPATSQEVLDVFFPRGELRTETPSLLRLLRRRA